MAVIASLRSQFSPSLRIHRASYVPAFSAGLGKERRHIQAKPGAVVGGSDVAWQGGASRVNRRPSNTGVPA